MSQRSSARSLAMALACVLLASPALKAKDADDRINFNVPAESLGKALRDYAVQARRNIAYSPAQVSATRSVAVVGEFTRDEALARLLTGSAMTAVELNEDTLEVLSSVAASGSAGAPKSPPDATLIRYAAASINENSDERGLEEIVVTGSHIRGVSTASETLQIGREDIDRSGYTSIADLMLSLPQNFGGGYTGGAGVLNNQVNTRYGDNPSAAVVPNLRGLGPGSTLTLLDGRRMASGLPGGGSDISSIPIDAIERIDVVTDSASAAYGSDAVAGVVNVILRKNFDGATTSASYGRATQGGGTEVRGSQLLGTAWGSGNVTLAVEHVQQDLIDASQRGFTSQAASPDSLLPGLRSTSVTMNGTQQVGTAVSVFVDGLFVTRDTADYRTIVFLPEPEQYGATLRRYSAETGINVDLPRDWKGTFSVNSGEDFTEDQAYVLTTPERTANLGEQLRGFSQSAEVNANGPLGSIASVPIRLALGAGYRRESFSELQGDDLNSLSSLSDGSRRIRYAFAELSVPLVENGQRVGLRRLEWTLSGRTEHYSDVGGSTVPKIGVIYGPSETVTLRSTWGKAFRAPNLADLHGAPQLVLLGLSNPASSTGTSPVLIPDGGNPDLKPETARAWSVGADWSPASVRALQVSITGFDIKYTNRITAIVNPYAALTDPTNAFFVTRAPSVAAVSALYDSYSPGEFYNATSAPYDPAAVAAIVDARLVNVASETARGADLTANYRLAAGSNDVALFLNGSYLSLTQRYTPTSPDDTLSGNSFYPSRLRVRSGATWVRHEWAVSGIVNWTAREDNTQVSPAEPVASWTTIDATVRYSPLLTGWASGLHVTLSATNLFNRNPPQVVESPSVGQGFDYDALNTNALGRYLRLQLSKQW